MKCTECKQKAIKKEVLFPKSTHPYVEYTHAPDVIIGRFALVDTCLVLFPTKEEHGL